MELVFLNADDFLKAHLALHGKVEPSVNTPKLVKISIVIGRTYDECEASLNNIFTVAAEYGIQLAQTKWNADTDKAAATAFVSCMLHLNRYGIHMDCSHRDLFLMIQDSWTQPDKLAVHMLNKYLNEIAAKHNLGCRSDLDFQLAANSISEPLYCHELANIATQLTESFSWTEVS
jgi:prophage maintenance system killer protein